MPLLKAKPRSKSRVKVAPKSRRKATTRSRKKPTKKLMNFLKLNKKGFAKKKFLIFIIAFAVIGGGYMAYRSFAFTNMVGADGDYTALTPARILDTRDGTGGYTKPVGPGQTYSVQITGKGGVPVSNVKSVVMNVTVTGGTAPSFLTIFPNGQSKPTTSNLNFGAGQTIPNQVTVMVGSGGKVQLFNSSGSANVIFDVAGYFSDTNGNAGSRFYSVSPSRIFDTRSGVGGYTKPVGPGQTYTAQVTGVDGVPTSGVKAVVMNVTVTGATSPSFLTVWPSGEPKPSTSSLNFGAGQTIPNQVTVKVGPDGKVNLYNLAGSVNAIFDIAGYYQENGMENYKSQEGRFVPVSPKRILDTRTVSTGPVKQTAYPVAVNSMISASNVKSVVLNVTATGGTAPSFLTVWPSGEPRPATSSLNFNTGETIPNQVTVKVGNDGKINLFNAGGSVHTIVDVAGYYVGYEESTSLNTATYTNQGYSQTQFQKMEFDFRPTSFSNAVESKVSLSVGTVSAFMTLNSTGDAMIDFSCYLFTAEKCKKLATDGTLGQNINDMSGLGMSIPYKFSLNKSYKFISEIKTDQPGYPGKWDVISIVDPNGLVKPLMTHDANTTNNITGGFIINTWVIKYSCKTTTPLSWNIENLKLNSQPATPDLIPGVIFDAQLNKDLACKGFSHMGYIPDAATINGLKFTLGVPEAQRDKINPVISSVVKKNGQVVVTSSDDKEVVDIHAYITPKGGTPQSGYHIGDSVSGKTYTTSFNFYNVPPATYNVYVIIRDGSGNITEKTVPIYLP